MKATKKEVKKKVVKKKETNERRKDDKRTRDLEEIVVGMGKRLGDLENLYKRVKDRLGL